MFKILLAVEFVPPSGIVLKPFGEPCHDGVLPYDAALEACHHMVLVLHRDELHIASEDAQGVEELDALADRHIGVDRAVEQEERGVDLVGIEERSLLDRKSVV